MAKSQTPRRLVRPARAGITPVKRPQVVEAVAHAVSALPTEQRRAALEAMIMPLVRPLQAALGAPGGREGALPSPPASAALVIQLVDRLTVVFRCTGLHMLQFDCASLHYTGCLCRDVMTKGTAGCR